MSNHKWFVYIIECSDKSLYAGITDDIERRWKEHISGNGCKYTRAFSPVKLLWTEPQPDRSSALKREAQIKRWTKAKKLALISGNTELLKKL